ncbi:hypothetical protein N2152v2_005617 [Parachlorella kessleri]
MATPALQPDQTRGPRRSFLPAFADARNRELDAEIRALENQLEQVSVAVEENSEHTKVLTEHLGNVRQEITYTQSRVTAKAKEVETEEDLWQLSQREAGRLQSEKARQQRARRELEERVLTMQKEVLAATDRMDRFKLAMNFNQEELEQWSAVAKQKDDDNLTLEKYMRQDEAKVKELNMQLEKTTREVQQKKQDLDDEITATQAAQTELNKAAEDFRRLHAERQELLQQWEDVLAAISKRDAAILEAGGDFANKKAELSMLKAELDALAAVLQQEEDTGATMEKRTTQREREIKRLYDSYTAQQATKSEAEDQLDLLESTSQKATEDLVAQQAANGHARADVEKRKGVLSATEERYEEAKARMTAEGRQLGSLQQRMQELEALRQKEEERAAALEKEIAALTKQQTKAGQDLYAARQQQQDLTGEISGARAQGRNLGHQMARLEEQMVRQQEVLYNVDFQLVQMERRVARAAGERTQDETAALNARIKALSQAFDVVSAEHSMLMQQVKQAQDHYARAQRQSQTSSKQRSSVLEEMSRMAVETESIARAVKVATKKKEEKLVEADVWRLEMRRLSSLLASKAGDVMSLEHRKRALELNMTERRQEISVQMELMQGESRLLRDEVHRLTLELKERQQALDKLRNKYETLMTKARTPDGEELQSQAYYIIKAAQEKQELQAEADEVAARIQQTEREFNHNQEIVDEQATLKQQLDDAFMLLKVKRSEESSRQQDLEEARARLDNLVAEEGHMQRLLEDLHKQKSEVEQQLREQEERAARAAQRADKLKNRVAAKGNGLQLPAGAQPADICMDVQLAQVKDATRSMLDQLRTLAAEHPDASIAQQVEKDLGVKLGTEQSSSRPGSLHSSPAPSVRSGSTASPSVRSSYTASPRAAAAASRAASAAPRPGSSGSMASRSSSVRSSGSLSVRTMQLGL